MKTAVVAAVISAALAIAPGAGATQSKWRGCGSIGGMATQAWTPTKTPCRVARDVVRYVEHHAVLGGKVFKLDGRTWKGYWYEGSTARYQIDQVGRWWWSVRARGHRLPAGAFGGS